jgi:cytochrome c553
MTRPLTPMTKHLQLLNQKDNNKYLEFFSKKSRPATAGILSGIGETLSNDDIADKGEWFKFKKKENKRNLKTYTTETSRTEIGGSKTEKEDPD